MYDQLNVDNFYEKQIPEIIKRKYLNHRRLCSDVLGKSCTSSSSSITQHWSTTTETKTGGKYQQLNFSFSYLPLLSCPIKELRQK